MDKAHETAFGAVKSGDGRRLAELLAEDPTLAAARDENGVSLRLQACYHRRVDMLAMLRDAGPPLDIFEAAALPDAEVRGEELLAADPGLARAWSSDGFTPLHLASFFGRAKMAAILLDRGAEPDAVARNPMSVQPLHSAAAARDTAIIGMLLDHGADVNARQVGGWTPLHAAAMFGDARLAELLLSRGAVAHLQNDQGKAALDLAVEKGHTQVADVLRRQPAGA
jgi:ankyrin repeat protein